MRSLLILSLIIGVSYSAPCEKQATTPTVEECNKLFDDFGCQCSCASANGMDCDVKEGCDRTICPSTTQPPDPTTTETLTTETSTTETPTTTDISSTTTEILTTETTTCICPTYSPPTITAAPKSKGSGGSGIGIGECDCKDGVVELRYVYLGTIPGVQIDLYTGKKDAELICSYENVQPNQEIVCNLRGDAPGTGLIKQGLEKFSTESPFIITYPNSETCEAQYHTSCSQDIVGVIQDECNQLIVSGWKDNANYDNGGDCDDGISPCICDHPVLPKTTSFQPDTTFGNVCYCSTGEPSMSTTASPKSKGGKSKGGKSKGSKSSNGLGVGDCDCEGGQIDLTMMYKGTETVNIECIHKSGEILNRFKNIENGQEITCSVENSSEDKLGTETDIILFDNKGNEICMTQIHTSCSRDIVGTYGDGECDDNIIVTGWRDIGNGFNGNGCDDGFEQCPCTTTTTDNQGEPALVKNEKETGNHLIFGNGNTRIIWYVIGAISVVVIIVLVICCYCKACICSFWNKEYKPVLDEKVNASVNVEDGQVMDNDTGHVTVGMTSLREE